MHLFGEFFLDLLHLYSIRSTDHRGQTAKPWLSLLPLFLATVVAITRTMDYRHHWQDISVGLTVGFVTAYFSYRQYYPSLDNPLSHFPYAPRKITVTSANDFNITDNGTEEGGIRRKGKGRDLETGNVAQDDDLIDIGYEPEGTVPRDGVDLKRVWSKGSEASA
jgi:diacylglycerol diphosphate phosphatase/phosphatidate phosphatase